MAGMFSSDLYARIHRGCLPHIIASQSDFVALRARLTVCLEQENSGTRGDIVDARQGCVIYAVRKRPIGN